MEKKKDNDIPQDIKERLEGFPEKRVRELIDCIDFLKQTDKAQVEKPMTLYKPDYIPEAGP